MEKSNRSPRNKFSYRFTVISRDSENPIPARESLLDKIPLGQRYKEPRRMAELLVDGDPVPYLNLAKSIDLSLTKIRYDKDAKSWHRKVQNRLRTLKKCWRKENVKIKLISTPVKGYRTLTN